MASPPVPPRYFGNTQALIILFDDKGKPTEVNKISYAVAGQGKTAVAKTSAVARITAALEKDQYTEYRPARCTPPFVALGEYSGYNKLYGERLHCKVDSYPPRHITFIPNKGTTTISNLRCLPPEIRNTIYRLLLVFSQPIELLPKSSSNTRLQTTRAQNYCEQLWRKKIQPTLRLLRVSREVNEEAASIFYGENEFRFTNEYGWNVLHQFLTIIGPANAARLEHLVLPVPWKGTCSFKHSGASNMNSHLLGAIRHYYRRKGEQYYSRHPSPMKMSLRLLAASNNIRTLDLTLPVSFKLENYGVPLSLKSAGLRDVKVRLLHLADYSWMPGAAYVDDSQMPMRRVFEDEEGARWAEVYASPGAYAREKGWGYRRVVYGALGTYVVG